nr:uncharacterized protein LOC113402588 [Vanessa tameamea]
MKGSLVCDLREATRNMEAAVAELLRRHSKGANVERLERENSQLRAELATVTQRLEQLTAQFNAFQAKQGPTEPSDPSNAVAAPAARSPVAAPAARAPVASRKRAPAAQDGRALAGAAASRRASVAPRAPTPQVSRETGRLQGGALPRQGV